MGVGTPSRSRSTGWGGGQGGEEGQGREARRRGKEERGDQSGAPPSAGLWRILNEDTSQVLQLEELTRATPLAAAAAMPTQTATRAASTPSTAHCPTRRWTPHPASVWRHPSTSHCTSGPPCAEVSVRVGGGRHPDWALPLYSLEPLGPHAARTWPLRPRLPPPTPLYPLPSRPIPASFAPTLAPSSRCPPMSLSTP